FLPAVRSLRRFALHEGSHAAALEALQKEIAAAADPATAADLLVEKALLLDDRLAAPAPARAALQEALVRSPGHRGALMVAEAMADRSGEPAGRRAALEALLAAPGEDAAVAERARTMVRL